MTHNKDCACTACSLMLIYGYEAEREEYTTGYLDAYFDGIRTGSGQDYERGWADGIRRLEEEE